MMETGYELVTVSITGSAKAILVLKSAGKHCMNKIIIYGSHYGTTKLYADKMSERTHIKKISYRQVQDLNQYQVIIYVGALYAGGVLGLSKTMKR